ncbi:MAG: hypothetical protein ACD_74C00099G0011 [uncultured bacterium]|nr:MAG: hypothetical protein ACD_74C00099G0011 [uncultured bacterium]
MEIIDVTMFGTGVGLVIIGWVVGNVVGMVFQIFKNATKGF